MPNEVTENVEAYTKIAGIYDQVHPEIFNPPEQERLGAILNRARDAIQSDDTNALDYGCGTGNLTEHLVRLGFNVTAADVTPAFLRLIERQYAIPTVELVDGDPDTIPDGTYDLIGAYSVMHHIPDYLAVARALIGKVKPGGVVFIDHERNDNYWGRPPHLAAFHEANQGARSGDFWDPAHKRWQYLLRAATTPSRHVARLRKARRIATEGDIHVYADDHIEWDLLIAVVEEAGGEIVERMDYLAYDHDKHDQAVWEKFRGQCDDTTGVIARRRIEEHGR